MLSSSLHDDSIVTHSIVPNTTLPYHQQNSPNTNNVSNPAEWVLPSHMKGNKIYMKQYRQKQALKTQNINHAQFKPPPPSWMHNDVAVPSEAEMFAESVEAMSRQNGFRVSRKNILTADASLMHRQRRNAEEIQNIRNRTMMVTSSNAMRPRPQTMRKIHFFTSQNLNGRMNQYMNIFIRQSYLNSSQETETNNYETIAESQKLKKKLTPHERKMKGRKKMVTLSPKGSTINTISPQEDLSKLSKTLNLNIGRSPLINSLQPKKGTYLNINSSRRKKAQKNIIF